MSKELKVLELFSGIGAQHKALDNIGIKSICTQCDIDKYAIQSYNAIFEETYNLGDISLIDASNLEKDQWDLITYSFPCTSVSSAGLQAGLKKDSGTASSLLWECEKIIDAVRPKYLIMENVKALVSKKFIADFEEWLKILDSFGYKTKWKVLNAKNFGIPQNRERVFAVSIRNDIDQDFNFPEGYPLTIRLKDILETSVDQKYYLSDEIQKRFKYEPKGDNIVGTTKPDYRSIGQRDTVFGTEGSIGALVATDYKQPKQIIEPVICASRGRNPDNPSDRTTGSPTEQRLEVNSQGICNTLTSVQKDNWVLEPQIEVLGNYKPSGHECGRIMDVNGISPTIKENHGAVCTIAEPQEKRLFNIYGEDKGTGYAGNVWDKEAIAPTLKTMQGGNSQPMILDERMTKQAIETLQENECNDGDVINPFNKKVVNDGVCPTITTRPEGFKTANLIVENNDTITYKIRKLTPKECWRLMGFTDEDFNKAQQSGVSNCQLYKQAGNSIVVNVLAAIFYNLLKDTEYYDKNLLEQSVAEVIEEVEVSNKEEQLDLVDWINEHSDNNSKSIQLTELPNTNDAYFREKVLDILSEMNETLKYIKMMLNNK